MAKKKIAALLIAAAVAAGGWALPARVSAAENDGTAVTWQQDETENSEQNLDEEAAVQEQMKSERLKADLITNRLLRFQVRTTNRSRKRNFLPAG